VITVLIHAKSIITYRHIYRLLVSYDTDKIFTNPQVGTSLYQSTSPTADIYFSRRSPDIQ
jgi:hypothetical protein